MAKIRGKEAQEAALKEINAAKKEMQYTKEFLETDASSGKFSIQFIASDGTKRKAFGYSDKKSEIEKFVLHYQHLVAERIDALAEENRIDLDIDEKMLFGIALTQEEQNILDERLLAELAAAEEEAALNTDSEESEEGDELSGDIDFDTEEDDDEFTEEGEFTSEQEENKSSAPFYNSADDIE